MSERNIHEHRNRTRTDNKRCTASKRRIEILRANKHYHFLIVEITSRQLTDLLSKFTFLILQL